MSSRSPASRKHFVIATTCSLLLLTLLLTAGCSAGQGDDGPTANKSGHIDLQSFSSFPQYKLSLLNYVKAKFTAECMSQAGYPQLAQTSIREPDRNLNELKVTSARFGPADEAHARRYGFGFGMDIPAQSPSVVSYDTGFDQNLERCGKQSWQRIGPDAQRIHETYMELFNTLGQEHDAALRALPEWTRLNQALLGCLAGSGYKPVTQPGSVSPGKATGTAKNIGAGADTTVAVHPKSFGIRLGAPRGDDEQWRPTPRKGTVQIGPALPTRPYVPTSAEVKFAVAYAGCNQKTGRTTTLMARSAQIQDQVMDKHETQISELNGRLDQLVRQASALIGRS